MYPLFAEHNIFCALTARRKIGDEFCPQQGQLPGPSVTLLY
jgi:hypothetical protein